MASSGSVTQTLAGSHPKIHATGAPTPPVFPDLKALRAAIPQHCFEPSALRSLGYLVRDVILAGAVGWAGATYIPLIPDATVRGCAWAVYGFVQGLVCVGIWILGHEAGHGSFSMIPRLNDVVGLFTHSLLCVPYYSWKFSHARHHQFTGHMEKDMVFVPKTREEYARKTLAKLEFLEDTPVYQLVTLVFHQLFGWPLYLLLNLSAGKDSLQNKQAGVFGKSHFAPMSGVFRKNEAPFIFLSDLGIAATLFALYKLSGVLDVQTVLLLYLQPYLWVHHWLIAITYLHHTHVDVPHYDAQNWTFVKGAIATIDRDFGFVGKHLFHGIIERHVVHHLFTKIPFYYADEATEAIKPILGDLYNLDERSFVGQLWSAFTTLRFVEPDASHPGAMKWVVKSQ